MTHPSATSPGAGSPGVTGADARAVVLARVRAALATPGTHHPRADGPARTTTGFAVPTDRAAVLDLFAERVEDYRATVDRVGVGEVSERVAAVLAAHADTVSSLAVPDGLDPQWLDRLDPLVASGLVLRHERDLGTAHEGPDGVEGIDAVITSATVGIATTGTFVLDHGPGQGARRLTLLPDLHLCVVRADQVVADVPEATTRLRDSIEAGRALTWVSGPSATSDIELDRVEGVHGPRVLHVLLTDG